LKLPRNGWICGEKLWTQMLQPIAYCLDYWDDTFVFVVSSPTKK